MTSLFAKRKKTVDLAPYLRRICDLTTPNLTSSPELERAENRYNRTIPILLCPWVNNQPVVEKGMIAITKDIGDRGVSVVLNHPIPPDEVVVGFWLGLDESPRPWYFLGSVRHRSAIGGGFWTAGIEFAEFVGDNYATQLAPLRAHASKLLPPAESAHE